jgi:hypothetical protein
MNTEVIILLFKGILKTFTTKINKNCDVRQRMQATHSTNKTVYANLVSKEEECK